MTKRFTNQTQFLQFVTVAGYNAADELVVKNTLWQLYSVSDELALQFDLMSQIQTPTSLTVTYSSGNASAPINYGPVGGAATLLSNEQVVGVPLYNVSIDPHRGETRWYIETDGTLTRQSFSRALGHEVWHALTGQSDPGAVFHFGINNAQDARDWLAQPGHDFQGLVAAFESRLGALLGAADNWARTSYFNTLGDEFGATNGRLIDATTVDRIFVDFPSAAGTTEDRIDFHQLAGTTLVLGVGGADKILGSQGADFLYGGLNEDTFFGNQGADFIHGGDLFRSHEFDGIDTVDYSKWDSFTAVNTLPVTVTLGGPGSDGGATHFGWDGTHNVVTVDDGHNGTDRLVSIEKIFLTNQADTVEVRTDFSLLGSDLFIDGLGATTGQDTLKFLGTTGVVTKGAVTTPTPGISPQGIELYEGGKATGVRLDHISKVIGTQSDDILSFVTLHPGAEATPAEQNFITASINSFVLASTGRILASVYALAKSNYISALSTTQSYQAPLTVYGGAGTDKIQASETGISTIYGGDGVDFLFGGWGGSLYGDGQTDYLAADGIESHLYGGDGADLFHLTNGAFIESDATNRSEDYVMWAGFQLSGGVQQYWMENGWAYFAPATSLISGALGAFGGVFTAVATLLDTPMMTTFRYAKSDAG